MFKASPTIIENCTLYLGDCLAVLPTLPADSVQCVMTSPPYFALRSYLPAGHPDKAKEIGSEPTPAAFVAAMVDVFRQVRRVLRPDGVCFINLGDSYGGSWGAMSHTSKAERTGSNGRPATASCGDGQLQNIPHRVAEALRADGWIWRQTVVWAKRSPMPESVSGWRWMRCRVKVGETDEPLKQTTSPGAYTAMSGGKGNVSIWSDCPGCPKCEKHGGYVLRRGAGRCTTAHEYIVVMAKSNRYFWDSEGSKEAATYGKLQAGFRGNGSPYQSHDSLKIGQEASEPAETAGQERRAVETRNPRSVWWWDDTDLGEDEVVAGAPPSVWLLSSEPTKVRHFATFPSELVRRCLVAGISSGGCCPQCGAPFAPVVEKTEDVDPTAKGSRYDQGKTAARDGGERAQAGERFVARCHGYRPTCDCGRTDSVGCIVLDPFSGIGTVAQTARQLGCRAIGIELHPDYHAVACKRVLEAPRWWTRKNPTKLKPRKACRKQQSLFV